MNTQRSTDTLLGLIFFGAMLGLGLLTVVLSDFRFGQETYEVRVLSDDVGYLRPGDPVLIYGMPSGKVLSLGRLPEPRLMELPGGRQVQCVVTIDVRLETPVYGHLPIDSRLIIEDRGLLGGKLIRIETGTSTLNFEEGTPLVATAAASVLQAAGEVLAENRENLRRSLDGLTEMVEHTNRQGGLLGSLIYDERMAEDAKALLASGRRSAEDIEHATATLRRGEGTLGRFVYDESFYTEATAILDRLASVADRLSSAADGLEGDGSTLGLLLNDTQFRDDLRKMVKLALGGIEDARESTPVQSVGSFLFGTF
ncbi:MAG: MlaD family protein [Planctomycetota bacterium]